MLLAGDAGGFVNGFTAEGIYYAMVSGELAGNAVAAAARGDMGSLAWRRGGSVGDAVRAGLRTTRSAPELRDSVLIQRYLFADRRRIARVIAARSPRPRSPG